MVEDVMSRIARVAAMCLVVSAPLMAVAQGPSLSGTVTYRERIALTAAAVLEVRLDDVTSPGAATPMIARVRFEQLGQVPIRFELPYDAAAINPRGRYAVRATISDGGVLLFASTDTTLVLTQGHGSRADLVLTRMAGSAAPARPAQAPPAPPLPPYPLPDLPATFVGTLPCADCPGIRYHLNLFPDDSFVLRMTYLDRPVGPLDDIGSWSLSSDRRVLVLQGRGEHPDTFAVSSSGTLQKLDATGQPIDGRVPHELTRTPVFQFTDVRVTMRGTYSHAEAAAFVECSTGQRWPVATDAAGADLERAYAAARSAPGAAVLVELDGLVAQRPKAGSAGTESTLVVEKVGRVLPRESCAPRFSAAPLTDTHWRLTNLADRAIPPAADVRREASLTFDAPMDGMPGAYSGSSGCNRVIGTYALANATMTLTGAGTLTACKDQAATEAAFLTALKATRTYRIAGRVLELMDAKGARLARFETKPPAGITVR
jgi:copper homeostasis protein (lipoprotein)